MYMKVNDKNEIIYEPTGRTVAMEAAYRAAKWYGDDNRLKLGKDYSLTDVGLLTIEWYNELLGEVADGNYGK